MKKSILTLGIIAASAIGALTSCQDMLTVETGDKAYVNANDTLYSYLGIMRAMQDVAERQVILGEIRGDLVSSTDYTTDTLYAISNFDNPQDQTCSMLQVSDYYNVINNCNFYIHNCDTSAIKSNIKYMIPEYAQVKAIRAWAYLQLVKNYEKVPYITKPVNNLSVIKNFDYQNNLVDKSTLIDRLLEDGILDFIDTEYPRYGNTASGYGTWNNGYTDISTRLCFIPIRLILGDLYLLRGASNSDFEMAAKYYYEFLSKESTPLYLQFTSETRLRNGKYISTVLNGWGSWASTYSYSPTTNEVISIIPGSANAGLGNMLTRVADIYGYTPSSSQSSDVSNDAEGNTNTDANGSDQYETSGSISVTRNWKRQYGPSNAYTDVNNQQSYCYYESTTGNDVIARYYEESDARYHRSIENLTYEGESYPLCAKAAYKEAFYYVIPIYRKTLIWLRLAEAINRAGYPEFAFAILKDGLNKFTIPTIGNRYEKVYDANGYQLFKNIANGTVIYKDNTAATDTYYYYDEDGAFIKYPSRVVSNQWAEVRDTIANDSIYLSGTYGAMYYLTDKEQIDKFNSFLNFKDDVWNYTYGIHARGCGYGSWNSGIDNASTYSRQTNIAGRRDTIAYDYSKLLLKQNVDIATATKSDIINAVENIIVDELALETAFEGNRFTDLVRIAEHKDASGYNGTDWLAKKIANRGTKAATSTAAAVDGYDASLYSKLQNKANWYFQLPTWNVK